MKILRDIMGALSYWGMEELPLLRGKIYMNYVSTLSDKDSTFPRSSMRSR